MSMRILVVLLLAACAAPPPDSPEPPRAIELPGTDWVLTAIRGEAPLEGSNITMTFDARALGGYNGCNWYGGDYRLEGSKVEIGEIGSTARGCLLPEGVGDQEAHYHRTLREARTLESTPERLILRDAAGATILEYRRRRELAMIPADLIGTRWRLVDREGEPPIEGTEITLKFVDAGRFEGFGSCREFTGTWVAEGDSIGFTSTTMSSTECNQPQSINEQEGDFTTDLSESRHWKLDGATLELYTDPGRTIRFVRVP